MEEMDVDAIVRRQPRICVVDELAHTREGLELALIPEGVTHVIFGHTARARRELRWRGSTFDRFLIDVPDAAVQVVPLSEA